MVRCSEKVLFNCRSSDHPSKIRLRMLSLSNDIIESCVNEPDVVTEASNPVEIAKRGGFTRSLRAEVRISFPVNVPSSTANWGLEE